MALEIKGVVKTLFPPTSGQSQKGAWTKQEILIHQNELKYPADVVVVDLNDKGESSLLCEGEMIIAHVNAQSREHKGRWYTELRVWKTERVGAPPKPQTRQAEPTSFYEEDGNELPF
jgi:hypothetical protein